MFPKQHFHQEIVSLKNKHYKPYILPMNRIMKVKHLDLIYKIFYNLVLIFGPILPPINHMEPGSFTQIKHTTLISHFSCA